MKKILSQSYKSLVSLLSCNVYIVIVYGLQSNIFSKLSKVSSLVSVFNHKIKSALIVLNPNFFACNISHLNFSGVQYNLHSFSIVFLLNDWIQKVTLSIQYFFNISNFLKVVVIGCNSNSFKKLLLNFILLKIIFSNLSSCSSQ